MAKAKKEYIAVCNFFKNTQPWTRDDMRSLLREVLGGEIQAWMEMNKEMIVGRVLSHLTNSGRREIGGMFYERIAMSLAKDLTMTITQKKAT